MKKLNKNTKEKNKLPKSRRKLTLYVIGLVICILAILSLIKFGTVLFLLPIWNWIAHSIINATGLNIWLAKAMAALLIVPLIYIAALVFSLSKKKRKTGIILLSIAVALICVSMFLMTKDTYFSLKNGEATKWYIITPHGDYKFSTSPGFDPVWGKEYQVVTPDIVEEYDQQEQTEVYSALPKDQYFDMKTGKPVKWYALLPDSSIEIFANPGVHPKYGITLKPVTGEIVWEIEKNNFKLKKKITNDSSYQKTQTYVTVINERDLGDIILHEDSILSPEEAKNLLQKVKTMTRNDYFDTSFDTFFDYLNTLKENADCSPLFCWILEKKYTEWPAQYVKKIIKYIRKEKNSNSLPILMLVYQNSTNPKVRERAKEAYTFIKTGKGFLTTDKKRLWLFISVSFTIIIFVSMLDRPFDEKLGIATTLILITVAIIIYNGGIH